MAKLILFICVKMQRVITFSRQNSRNLRNVLHYITGHSCNDFVIAGCTKWHQYVYIDVYAPNPQITWANTLIYVIYCSHLFDSVKCQCLVWFSSEIVCPKKVDSLFEKLCFKEVNRVKID